MKTPAIGQRWMLAGKVVPCRYERAQEIHRGTAAKFFVERLVAVTAQASVTRGLFSAVAARNSRQRRVQHVAERTGDADGAAGPAGDRIEDDQRGLSSRHRVQGAVDIVSAYLQPLRHPFEQSVEG